MAVRVCFVTGTRAEFGLMETTLRAIADHPDLELQLVATGMHLSRAHGQSLLEIHRRGWRVQATVPWDDKAKTPASTAAAMGTAIHRLAGVFEKLKTDVVLVAGDRVEAFAAASAGHISQRIVAHVHGGDRAQGIVDDALRHAITKLSHIHFPATADSAKRILKLGEVKKHIHVVGTPGIDGVKQHAMTWEAMSPGLEGMDQRQYALVLLHPVDSSDAVEYRRAKDLATAVRHAGFARAIFVHPNNDPGWRGISKCWNEQADDKNWHFVTDVPREIFLGLLNNAALLIGNSSSGIIEAATFRTWVINIGSRQAGRLRSSNVLNCSYNTQDISKTISKIWKNKRAKPYTGKNVYGGDGVGKRIAKVLADLPTVDSLLRKLITY